MREEIFSGGVPEWDIALPHVSQKRRDMGHPHNIWEERLLERLDCGRFVVFYVEDGVELGDL